MEGETKVLVVRCPWGVYGGGRVNFVSLCTSGH